MRSSVEYKDLILFQKKLERLKNQEYQKFLESCAKEIAGRLLAKVIEKTPTGIYDKKVNFTTKDGKQVSFTPKTGKLGGTLKRGWTSKTHQEAEGGAGAGKEAMSYARSLPVTRGGRIVSILIFNPVFYGVYVEFGHRTRDHKDWIQGKFMLTNAELEMKQELKSILQGKLDSFFRRAFR